MPGIIVSEPLNPGSWEVEQQQAVYDELVTLLDISTGPDLPAMTDEELTDTLHEVIAEIKTRDAATTIQVDSTQFYDDVIQTESASNG